MRREFHGQGDELEDVELEDELEELEDTHDIVLFSELELEELTERRYRLEVALERVKQAIKQRLEEEEL